MLGVTWRGRQSAHPQILIVFLSAISGAALAGARQRRLILDYGGGWWRVVEGGWGVSTAGHYRHIWSPHWATPSQQNMQTGVQSAELPPICFVRLPCSRLVTAHGKNCLGRPVTNNKNIYT